jgi:small subunit ribosomal protein S6
MTNTYEMMFILRPDLTGEQVNQQLHKYSAFLKENGAQKVSIEVWAKRRLAYPIQKFQDGTYILTYYTGDGSQVAKVEKNMRFSEEVIRYLTIKLDPDFEFEEKAIPEIQVLSSVEPKKEVQTNQEVSSSSEVKTETEKVAVEG